MRNIIKKMTALVLSCIIAFSLCSLPANAASTLTISYNSTKIIISSEKAYCYSWNTTSSKNYGYYPKGTIVNVLGTTNDGWYYLSYNGTSMFINPSDAYVAPCINVVTSQKYTSKESSYKKFSAYTPYYDPELSRIADVLYYAIMNNKADEDYPIYADPDKVLDAYEVLKRKYLFGIQFDFNISYYTDGDDNIIGPTYVALKHNDMVRVAQKVKANEHYMDLALSSIDFTGVTTTAQKVKLVNDFLCDALEYDYNKASSFGSKDSCSSTLSYRSAFECLENNKGVCADYTLMFMYMLNRIGVNCNRVVGYGITNSGTENHAWNVVINDYGFKEYYDVTWNDTLNNRYFALNYNQISTDHIEKKICKLY